MLEKQTNKLLDAILYLNPEMNDLDKLNLFNEVNTLVISFRRLSALRTHLTDEIQNNVYYYNETEDRKVSERCDRWENRLNKRLNKYGLQITKGYTHYISVCTLDEIKPYYEIYLV